MRKFTILFISIILLNSCTSGQKKYSEESICPYIFVSGEHKDYYSYGKENVSEEMAYIATINNFKMKCKQSERKAIFSILDILFIITPLKTDVDNYEFSYFVSILNNDNEILDYQIFTVKENFSSDDNINYKEDELIEVLEQYLPQESDLYKIAIGFVLDEEKYNFIND